MWKCDDTANQIAPETLSLKGLVSEVVTCAFADPDKDEFPNPDPFPIDDDPAPEPAGGGESRPEP